MEHDAVVTIVQNWQISSKPAVRASPAPAVLYDIPKKEVKALHGLLLPLLLKDLQCNS